MSAFQVGKTYQVRSIGDWECIFSFTVEARTAKFVTVRNNGKALRVGVTVRDGVETARPFGTYSMCPTIRADREFV